MDWIPTTATMTNATPYLPRDSEHMLRVRTWNDLRPGASRPQTQARGQLPSSFPPWTRGSPRTLHVEGSPASALAEACSCSQPLNVRRRNNHGCRPPPTCTQSQRAQHCRRQASATGVRRHGLRNEHRLGRPAFCASRSNRSRRRRPLGLFTRHFRHPSATRSRRRRLQRRSLTVGSPRTRAAPANRTTDPTDEEHASSDRAPDDPALLTGVARQRGRRAGSHRRGTPRWRIEFRVIHFVGSSPAIGER